MQKRLVLFVVLLAATTFFFTLPSTAFAYDYVPSAFLQQLQTSNVTTTPNVEADNRAQILESYLEKQNSPLAPYAQNFIQEADKNNLDWKLLVAISGVESGFGQQIPPTSYNGWGFGIYGNNVRRFSSWEEAITTVSSAIRSDYMDKWGAQNIYQIGSKYAADPFWAGKVARYISDINSLQTTTNTQNQPKTLSLAL